MNLEKIKDDWKYYCKETEENDIVDVDLHFGMAMYVGALIEEIDRLQNELKNSLKINFIGKLPVPPERHY